MFGISGPKSRLGPVFGLVIGSLGFVTFLFFFYFSYWKWRDCFNELGRCYSPDGSMHVYTTGGMVWGFFSVPCLLVALASVWILLRRHEN